MNLNEPRKDDLAHAISFLTTRFLILFLGVIFWSALCLFAAAPAWLPAIVEGAMK